MTPEASMKVMRELKEMSGIVDKSNNMHGLRHTGSRTGAACGERLERDPAQIAPPRPVLREVDSA